MKVIQLLLIICFIVSISCNARDVLKCAVGKMNSEVMKTFVSRFKINSLLGYSYLNGYKSDFNSAINKCLGLL